MSAPWLECTSGVDAVRNERHCGPVEAAAGRVNGETLDVTHARKQTEGCRHRHLEMRRERPRSWSSPMAIWMLFALVVYPSTVLPLRSKIFGGEKD
jgi:hypothetical protein